MSLDEVLLRRWNQAAAQGVMNTNVDDTLRRVIPGELGLVIQFNPIHLKSKRPMDKLLLGPSIGTKSAKPKASAFNFTKAKRKEFLSGLRFVTADARGFPSLEIVEETEVSKIGAQHFVLVNVAPLVTGHVLVVPDMALVQPQKMTKTYLMYAISITQAMHRDDFALGFNSAGAWSSVNHFHFQGYFFPQVEGTNNFPVVAKVREELFRTGGAVVKTVPQWKTTCYVIELEYAEGIALPIIETAWTLLDLLQTRVIPHNILVVGTVVFVFPRQPQQENGTSLLSAFDTTGDDPPTAHPGRLRVAVAELSGLVIAGDAIAYENLTEEVFNLILQTEVSLSLSEEAELISQWKARIGGEMTQ